MMKKEGCRKDPLGRWSTFRLEGNGKVIQIMTVYRIPESTQPGIMKSRAQYDRSTGSVKMSRQYRQDILESISKEIKTSKNENINDFLIAGDFNQDVNSNQMQKFIRENGLEDVHKYSNHYDNQPNDNTHINGRN